MRLLYVCNDFGIRPDGVKGASVHLRAVTAALASLGHELSLLSPHASIKNNAPHALLPPGCPPVKQAVKPLKTWLAANGFAVDLARDLRPLVYNTWAPTHAMQALSNHPPHAIIERLSLFSTVGMELSRALNIPLLVEVNAIVSEEARSYRTLSLANMAGDIERRTFDHADALMPVSQPLADRLIHCGADASKIHVVSNGVELRHFAPTSDRQSQRRTLGLNGEFVVGFAGSLKPWHGVDALMHAFAQLHRHDHHTKLLIVGAGPMLQELRSLADTLSLTGSVIFTGAVEHQRIPRLLSAMDVATAPYPPMDAFYFSPLKLFEYMAAGLPVVTSRQGQIPQIIEHNRAGLLYPPGDVDALAQALNQLKTAPSHRRLLGRTARNTVCQCFTWRHTAQRITHITQQSITGHDPSSIPVETNPVTGVMR